MRPLKMVNWGRARLLAETMSAALSQAFREFRQGNAVDLKKALEAAYSVGRRDLSLGAPKAHNAQALWVEARLSHHRCVFLLAPVAGLTDWQWAGHSHAMRKRLCRRIHTSGGSDQVDPRAQPVPRADLDKRRALSRAC